MVSIKDVNNIGSYDLNEITDRGDGSKHYNANHSSVSNNRPVPIVAELEILNEEQLNALAEAQYHTPERSQIPMHVGQEGGAGDAARIGMKYVVATGYLETNGTAIAAIPLTSSSVMHRRQFLKLKIAYTEDHVTNEYVVWYVIYEGSNKCRRNLLTDFQNASNDQQTPAEKD